MEDFVTSDLALVTYLRLNGFSTTGLPEWVLPARTCYWTFPVVPLLEDLVDRFRNKEALVEPTEYNRVFGETKKELYGSRPVPLKV